MGRRDWNQFQFNADQAVMESTIRAMADQSRAVNGTKASLRDVGYSDVGLDDCWQKCDGYGQQKWTYHDAHGAPVIDTVKFPALQKMTALGHSLNCTMGWYHNNCRCHDHCTSAVCFAADVNATLALGLDSVKLDGCGAEEDVALWSALFNHSIRTMGRTAGGQHEIRSENCHNGVYTKGWGPPSGWPADHNYRRLPRAQRAIP